MRRHGLWARIMAICLALSPVAAMAGGMATMHSLAAGTVALTNGQANSAWVPVAVLWKFDRATNAVISVERISQSNTFVLGAASVSNATSAVWVPEAEYPFALGDVLRVGSSVTNGVAQVIRKGE
jgi:hypothetical protein